LSFYLKNTNTLLAESDEVLFGNKKGKELFPKYDPSSSLYEYTGIMSFACYGEI